MEQKVLEIIANALADRNCTILNDDEDSFLVLSPDDQLCYRIMVVENEDTLFIAFNKHEPHAHHSMGADDANIRRDFIATAFCDCDYQVCKPASVWSDAQIHEDAKISTDASAEPWPYCIIIDPNKQKEI